MAIWQRFVAFISRGNVFELAVAVTMGTAFEKVITSLISDIITPALLSPALHRAGLHNMEDLVVGEGIKYGRFLALSLSFIVIAVILFPIILLIEYIFGK